MKKLRDPDLLREAMRERKVSHRQLEGMAQVGRGKIYDLITRGKSTTPAAARAIARSLERSVADLFVDTVTARSGHSDPTERAA
jgi:hypothetical protein